MNLIEPTPIAEIGATNVPTISTAPEWQSGEKYTSGDKVQYQGKRIYEAIGVSALVTSPDLEATFDDVFFRAGMGDAFSPLRCLKSGYLGVGPKLHEIATGVDVSFTLPEDYYTHGSWSVSADGTVAAFIITAASYYATKAQCYAIAYNVATQTEIGRYNLGASKRGDNAFVDVSPDGAFIAVKSTDAADRGTLILDAADMTLKQSLDGIMFLAWDLGSNYIICQTYYDELSPSAVFLRRFTKEQAWGQNGERQMVEMDATSGQFSPDGRWFVLTYMWSDAEGFAIYDTLTWAITGSLREKSLFAIPSAVSIDNNLLVYKDVVYNLDDKGKTGDPFVTLAIADMIPSDRVLSFMRYDRENTSYVFNDGALYFAAITAETDLDTYRDVMYLYKSIIANSVPPEWTKDVVGTERAAWLDLGATNPYKPFDDVVGTLATGAETYSAITYNPTGESALNRGLAWALTPGVAADSLVVLGITGDYLDVRVMSDADIELFGQRVNVANTSRAAIFGIGLPATGTLRISVAKATGDASVGNILLGDAEYLGALDRDGLEISGVDYSIVTETPQGALDLSPGNRTARNNYVIIVPNGDATRVFERIGAIGGKKIVLVGSQVDEWALTILYGVRERWSLRPWSASEMKLSMTARGLV